MRAKNRQGAYPSKQDPSYKRLFKICRSRGCPREDAEDLVQEAYLRLLEYQRYAEVKDTDSLLRRIVINLSINYYHRRLMTPFVFENVEKLEKEGVLTDHAPDQERALLAAERLGSLTNQLNTLNTRMVKVFMARRVGYSDEEVAIAFGIQSGTVEKYVAITNSALKRSGSTVTLMRSAHDA